MTTPHNLHYVPGMPYVLDEDGNRLPDVDKLRASPFTNVYAHSQMHARPTLACGPTLTQGEFKDECDINQIMRRYTQTGRLPITPVMAAYGDFSETGDYQTMLQQVLDAQAAFGELPSNIRERFNHDPGRLLMFLNDPMNLDEAVKLGLVTAPASPPVTPTPAPQGSDPK